jgi:hypothetical protein
MDWGWAPTVCRPAHPRRAAQPRGDQNRRAPRPHMPGKAAGMRPACASLHARGRPRSPALPALLQHGRTARSPMDHTAARSRARLPPLSHPRPRARLSLRAGPQPHLKSPWAKDPIRTHTLVPRHHLLTRQHQTPCLIARTMLD